MYKLKHIRLQKWQIFRNTIIPLCKECICTVCLFNNVFLKNVNAAFTNIMILNKDKNYFMICAKYIICKMSKVTKTVMGIELLSFFTVIIYYLKGFIQQQSYPAHWSIESWKKRAKNLRSLPKRNYSLTFSSWRPSKRENTVLFMLP